ncbi:MAG: hypothetical protein R2857_11990 [Vampirovibrionales bacterium]
MSTTVGQQAPETFAKALGRVASGIYIISTGRVPDAQGMLTSWVMQAGFEPPQLTIAVAGNDPSCRNWRWGRCSSSTFWASSPTN